MNQKVSVVLLSYNQSSFVLDCLRGFENQTFRDFEIVIIDDGSSDDSLEKIKSWSQNTQIKHKVLVNKQNLGICRTINRALSFAEGAFVCIMACDDWPEPNYLQVMFESISRANDDVAFVFARTIQVDEEGIPLEVVEVTDVPISHSYEPTELFDKLLKSNFIEAPAVIIRKSAIQESGNYDETLFFEDYDMWLKLSSQYSAIEIEMPLVNYRIVSKSMSRNTLAFLERKSSEIRVLLKWEKTKKENKEVIALRIRNLAVEMILQNHFAEATEYIDASNSVDFDFRWSVFRQFLRIQPARNLIKKWLASK